MPATLDSDEFERLARKRVAAKMGWFTHASAYSVVNALLVAVSVWSGKGWAVFPLMGWGLGLAIHGAVVWWGGDGSIWYEKLLQAERRRLQAQRDPW